MAAKRVPDEKLLEAWSRSGSLRGCARILGLDRNSVRDRMRRMNKPEPSQVAQPEPAPVVEPCPIETLTTALIAERPALRERNLVRVVAKERSLRAYLEDLFTDIVDKLEPPPAYVPPPAAPITASVETALLHWSDWHAYETVVPSRVQGLNQYNGQIMCSRVRRVVQSSLAIRNRLEHGGGWSVPEAVIALNGDFVSGTIHEVERHSDAPNICMAVFATGQVLAQAIRDVAAEFRSVRVYATPGNHGRLPDARKMQQKDPTRNWDTLVYLFAKQALADCPNVTFSIPDAYAASYAVGGRNFLQYHGHDIKSTFSIPYYGIARYGRNMNSLRSRIADPIDYFLIGHFHSSAEIPAGAGRSLVNGSLIGGTEFSVNGLGECDEPAQSMYFVSDRNLTGRWPIWAEGPDDVDGVYKWDAWDELV